MEFVQLFGEQPATPRPSVNPVDDLFDGKEHLVFCIYGHQFPANLRVPSPPAANGDKEMMVSRFEQVKRA
jgi:hypothetical protein